MRVILIVVLLLVISGCTTPGVEIETTCLSLNQPAYHDAVLRYVAAQIPEDAIIKIVSPTTTPGILNVFYDQRGVRKMEGPVFETEYWKRHYDQRLQHNCKVPTNQENGK